MHTVSSWLIPILAMVTVGFFIYCMLTVVFGFSKNMFSSIRSLWDAMSLVKVITPIFRTVETVSRQVLSNGKELIIKSVSRKRVGTQTDYYRRKSKKELRQERELHKTQYENDRRFNERVDRVRRKKDKHSGTGGIKGSSSF